MQLINKEIKRKKEIIAPKEESYPLEWVENTVRSLKPKRNKEGGMKYKHALQYLTRVIDQNSPHFDLVLGLASFATANHLTDKQKEKAHEIIAYYEELGVL